MSIYSCFSLKKYEVFQNQCENQILIPFNIDSGKFNLNILKDLHTKCSEEHKNSINQFREQIIQTTKQQKAKFKCIQIIKKLNILIILLVLIGVFQISLNYEDSESLQYLVGLFLIFTSILLLIIIWLVTQLVTTIALNLLLNSLEDKLAQINIPLQGNFELSVDETSQYISIKYQNSIFKDSQESKDIQQIQKIEQKKSIKIKKSAMQSIIEKIKKHSKVESAKLKNREEEAEIQPESEIYNIELFEKANNNQKQFLEAKPNNNNDLLSLREQEEQTNTENQPTHSEFDLNTLNFDNQSQFEEYNNNTNIRFNTIPKSKFANIKFDFHNNFNEEFQENSSRKVQQIHTLFKFKPQGDIEDIQEEIEEIQDQNIKINQDKNTDLKRQSSNFKQNLTQNLVEDAVLFGQNNNKNMQFQEQIKDQVQVEDQSGFYNQSKHNSQNITHKNSNNSQNKKNSILQSQQTNVELKSGNNEQTHKNLNTNSIKFEDNKSNLEEPNIFQGEQTIESIQNEVNLNVILANQESKEDQLKSHLNQSTEEVVFEDKF